MRGKKSKEERWKEINMLLLIGLESVFYIVAIRTEPFNCCWTTPTWMLLCCLYILYPYVSYLCSTVISGHGVMPVWKFLLEFLLCRKILFRLALCSVSEQSKIIWVLVWRGTSLERIIRVSAKARNISCVCLHACSKAVDELAPFSHHHKSRSSGKVRVTDCARSLIKKTVVFWWRAKELAREWGLKNHMFAQP